MMMMMMIRQFIKRRKMCMNHYKGAVYPVHAMNTEQQQTATDPWTKPIGPSLVPGGTVKPLPADSMAIGTALGVF